MEWNDLKQIAESKKIEVRELANEMEMTPNGLRESIKQNTISLKRLRHLCEILHINPTMFFDHNKGVYMNNVHFQSGNGNKISLENKDREIEMLKQRLNDKDTIINNKDEIIEMLRSQLNLGLAASPKENPYGKKK